MQVRLSAEQRFDAAPATVFTWALDPARFVEAFRGAGPIPALTNIELHGPPGLGAERSVHSADGAVLRERVTAFEPGRRHGYTLSGLRPPLAWLVQTGEADWRFEPDGEGSRVRWDYVFTLTSALAWPIAAPMLTLFMRRAMRDCLGALSREPAR